MITVGEYLQEARTRRKQTLEQVEKATKIRAKFLDALEKNQFEKLPDQTFTKGFIRNYATYLGLPPTSAMAFYRRQVDEGKSRHLPERGLNPLIRRFSLTPQLFTGAVVGIVLILFFGYLIYSYITFAGAPVLDVTSPKNNSVVKREQLVLSGKTDPDGTLNINGQQVTVNKDGTFSVALTVLPGLNTFTFSAKNKYQKETKVVRSVRLEK